MNIFFSFILGIVTVLSGYGFYTDTTPREMVDALGSSMTGSAWFVNTSNQIQSAVSTWGLRIPGLASAGDCLVTDINGVVSTSACGTGGSVSDWQQTNGALTPTTTIGIRVNASSTIGDGTGAGGLTIYGNATTTNNLIVQGTGTSTFAGGINMGTNHLVAHGIQASESGGLHIHSNNGTEVAFFGVGGGANSTFSGGVNIDGATRLATSLNGFGYLTNGAVTGINLSSTTLNAPNWTNKYVLQASTTSASGYDWVSTSTLGFGGAGTVTSVDMSVPTGLSISGNPITTSGTLALAYASGYAGVLTASTTNWNNFYDTPSTRISDGLGLTWSSNTLNCDTATGLNFGCLLAADWTTFNNKVSSTSIDTSAELAALVTDETGTDKLVFSASPTFTGTAGFADLTGTNATITSATTTNLAVTGLFNFLGTVITNVATWFSTTLNAVSSFVAAASSTWDFGGAASLELPNGASPTVDATGEIALDTTFGQLKYFDGGTTHVLTGTTTKGFNIASTTKDGTGGSFNTGTTTLLLINDAEPQTLIGWYCQATTTGSVSVRFGDGTNWTNNARCSTGAFTTASSNNTFTSFEGMLVQVGSQATNPSRVTVSPVFKKTEQ